MGVAGSEHLPPHLERSRQSLARVLLEAYGVLWRRVLRSACCKYGITEEDIYEPTVTVLRDITALVEAERAEWIKKISVVLLGKAVSYGIYTPPPARRPPLLDRSLVAAGLRKSVELL